MLPNGWNQIRDFMEVMSRFGLLKAIYRGQPNDAFELVPSAFRPGGGHITHPVHLRSWKWRASSFATPIPRDDIEWLVLAQHYGLETALLDWTTSPLVALFFACQIPSGEPSDGCVWSAKRPDFDEPDDTMTVDAFAEQRPRPLLINAIGRNARSTAQDGVLTLHTRDDYYNIPATRIFTVPHQDKAETLVALGKLGFTAGTLYSDITRLVEQFKEETAGRRIGL